MHVNKKRMALAVFINNSVITLSMMGCHNGHHDTKTNGCGVDCGEIRTFDEKFHPYIVTPITRLFLHSQLGPGYKIDELVAKFDTYFSNNQNHQESGIDYWKKIILESLQNDLTWGICPSCDFEYKNGTRMFENVNYIAPQTNLCYFHK